MSRSNYSDDLDILDLGRWRGWVASAIRGRRGQAFLREMAAALDAMPVKQLIAERLEEDGDVCAIGAVCVARGMTPDQIDRIDYDSPECVAEAVGIHHVMAAEIEYENDEGGWNETPEQRWSRMRRWVDRNLKQS